MFDEKFWKERDAAMKRFMAAKARKQERLALIETSLRKEFKERTGEDALYFNVW